MAKKPVKPTRPIVARGKAAKSTTRSKTSRSESTKQDQVLALLRRQNGASIDEIVVATDWQPHSVRGFLTAAVKKRLGINVISYKGEDGVRRYFVAPLQA